MTILIVNYTQSKQYEIHNETYRGAIQSYCSMRGSGTQKKNKTHNMEIDNIYNMDCLEGMKQITDASVDCIICDLPYGVLNRQSEGGGWDSIIPLEPLWEQYLRIAKPNAAIVLFCQGMFTAELMMSQKKLWRYNLIWKKGNRSTGMLNANRQPLRNHEDIAVFYRSQPIYNPQKTKGSANHGRGSLKGNHTNRCYGEFDPSAVTDDLSGMKFPLSVINIDKEHDGNQWHPTQKPVDLLRYLVLTYSNEGDVILDNCMGSGTTAIACIKEHRHFIGFELNEEYYKKSQERIKREKQQLSLF